MLDKYQNIKNKFETGEKKFSNALIDFSNAANEMSDHSEKTLSDLKNINIIISDINKQFSDKTGIINVKDMAFLWGAVAIQCVRWILIPTFDITTLTPSTADRKDSSSEGKKDKTATGKELDKNKEERDEKNTQIIST